MHRSLLSAVLSLSVLLSTVVAAQDASYTFTTIDMPGVLHTGAYGINEKGQIVGAFQDATGGHGFLATPDDGDGRRYTIVVSTTDTAGNEGEATATVTVPR